MADVSQIVLKDANGNVIGTYDVRDTTKEFSYKFGTNEATNTKFKISINSYTSWMLSFVVTLYSSYRSTKVMISGYNYGVNHWYSSQAVLLGDSTGETISVHFGYDSDWHLWVGFDVGNYLGATISDITNGYAQIDDLTGLFTFTKSSAFSGTVQSTVSARNPYVNTNTTYTFTGGTNKFTVTPSGGTAQDVTVTPSITNNITGSGTTNYVPKFTAANTIGNGYDVTSSVASRLTTSLVTSAGVYNEIASRTVMRDPFVQSSTSYNVDNTRGNTRFVYTTHGAPNTGTIVAFDSSDNINYTLQLLGGYSTDKLFFRTRYGDNSRWNDWLEANPRYQYNAIQGASSATYYIPTSMRGSGGAECQYLLSCPQANGGGGLYLLRPDTYSTQKMIITTLISGAGTVSQVSDPWGFIIRTGGYATVPSIIRL